MNLRQVEKKQFFSCDIIFILFYKLSDLRPWSQSNVIAKRKKKEER